MTSGISDDVYVLEHSDNAHAIEALDLFAYKARQTIGSLTAVLGGLDVLVFTAGIGEHPFSGRERICVDLSWLGVELDSASNTRNTDEYIESSLPGRRINAENSCVDVFVLPTDEQATIAMSVATQLNVPN